MQSVRLQLQPTVPRGAHLAAVDELKGIALILVLVYHIGGVLAWPNHLHGEIGVDLFLLLSGFTLALSSSGLPLGQFLTRRFLRIYPAYWLALTAFLVGHRLTFGSHYSAGNVALHYLGLQAYGGLSWFADINDSFWFISLIVVAYLVFAGLRRRLDDLSLILGICGALCLSAVLIYDHFHHIGGLVELAPRIPSFFAGMVAGRLLGTGTGTIRFNLALGLGLSVFYYLLFFRNAPFAYTVPALGLLLAWLPARRALARQPVGAWLLRPFALLGAISYEVYLFHQPIIRDYNRAFWAKAMNVVAPTKSQLVEGIAGGLALTLVIATGVHLLLGFSFQRLQHRSAPALATGAPYNPYPSA